MDIDPQVLRAAPMSELLHRPKSDAAHCLTEELFNLTMAFEEAGSEPRKRRRKRDAEEKLKATISALVRDLLKASTNAASEGFCYRPERSPDFTATLATFRQYEAVRDTLLHEGLIERVPGIRFGQEFDGEYASGVTGKLAGRSPRLRATKKLLTRAEDHGVSPQALEDHFERSYDTEYPMLLRKNLKRIYGRNAFGRHKTPVRFPRHRIPTRLRRRSTRTTASLRHRHIIHQFCPDSLPSSVRTKLAPASWLGVGGCTSAERTTFRSGTHPTGGL